MRPALSNEEVTHIRERLLYLAWRWHGLAGDEAEDLVQSAFETHLRLQEGASEDDLHLPMLAAILRSKCRDYVSERALAAPLV